MPTHTHILTHTECSMPSTCSSSPHVLTTMLAALRRPSAHTTLLQDITPHLTPATPLTRHLYHTTSHTTTNTSPVYHASWDIAMWQRECGLSLAGASCWSPAAGMCWVRGVKWQRWSWCVLLCSRDMPVVCVGMGVGQLSHLSHPPSMRTRMHITNSCSNNH
jgi:hypothetical protein